MSNQYIKNTNGRGVLLGNTALLTELKEKESLHQTIASLKTKIDMLEQRLDRLESQKKD
jgi:ubiquinone biosynthesis protein UbiJ